MQASAVGLGCSILSPAGAPVSSRGSPAIQAAAAAALNCLRYSRRESISSPRFVISRAETQATLAMSTRNLGSTHGRALARVTDLPRPAHQRSVVVTERLHTFARQDCRSSGDCLAPIFRLRAR